MSIIRQVSFVVCILIGCHDLSWCQKKDLPVVQGKDSVVISKPGKRDSPYKPDSLARKKHDPRRATLYSTFMPGLGQIYNRKYWKLPIVYAAVGIPAYTYFSNKSWYNKCQYALAIVLNGTTDPDSLSRVDPKLQPFVNNKNDNGLRINRNQYRQYEDYSILFFILFWGLNIVDATVDAHLMGFDVSSDLSMHVQGSSPPDAYGPGARNNPVGVSLVFDLHKARYKTIKLP